MKKIINKKEVASRLKKFGLDNFDTIKEFAEALGLNPSVLHTGYLSGRSIPGPELLVKLEEMGCDTYYLLIGKDRIVDKAVSERIIKIRTRLKIDKLEFSTRLNVSKKNIDDWENSAIVPDKEIMIRIAEIGKVDLAWLYTGKKNLWFYSINDEGFISRIKELINLLKKELIFQIPSVDFDKKNDTDFIASLKSNRQFDSYLIVKRWHQSNSLYISDLVTLSQLTKSNLTWIISGKGEREKEINLQEYFNQEELKLIEELRKKPELSSKLLSFVMAKIFEEEINSKAQNQ